MNTNNYAKAKEQWEKVLAISPDDDDTKSALKHIEEKLSKN
jgi:Tfp pilus assembly protein PilF